MSRPYPKDNPFPYQGTLSIEGTEASSDRDDPGSRAPTLSLDPVKRALRLTKDYLERFSVSEKRRGQFIIFRGDHGAGKTHTIYHVMDRVETGALRPPEGIPAPVQLYAKAEGPQFLDVYGRLVKQVSFDVLRELSRRFQGVMTGEQLGDELKDEAKGKEAAEQLRLNPDAVDELFRQAAVERGAVEERQAEVIDQVAGRASSDFRRIMSFLPGTGSLARSAYQWLTGGTLAPEEMRMLGISGPISSPEVGKWSVQLLAGLFRRAGRPLIIYLDQYEKLVLGSDQETAAQNIGRLHSLVEVIPRESGMLVLSGNEDAWGALPPDFRQRFADNVVRFPILTVEEAKRVVCLYLTPRGERLPWDKPEVPPREEKDSPAEIPPDNAGTEEQSGIPIRRPFRFFKAVSEDDLFPFTAAAVGRALQFGSGNIRRFLQICAAVLDKALPDQQTVGPDLVNQVLQESGRHYTRETVAQEIEDILRKRTLRFERNFHFEGITADIAVLPGGWGGGREPRLLVQISQALFSQDEANKALGHVELIQKLHEGVIPTRFVLVVLGYASPAVTKVLTPFVHDLVVYRADRFRADFEKALDRMPRAEPAAAQSREERELIQQQLADLRKSLQDVLETRKTETSALEKRLEELLWRQESQRANEKRPEARDAWIEERRHIEDQIRAARMERQKRALEELERLRFKAEFDRKQTQRLQAAAVGIGTAATTAGLIWFLHFDLTNFGLYPAAALVLFASAAAAATVFLMDRFRDRRRRELASPVVSREDLDHLAHDYLASQGFELRDETVLSFLRHPNPQLRYVGALAANGSTGLSFMVAVLRSERSSIVRQQLARQIGKLIDTSDLSPMEWPHEMKECGYMLEAFIERTPAQTSVPPGSAAVAPDSTGVLDRFRRSLQTLAVIVGSPPVTQGASLAMDLAAMLAGRSPVPSPTMPPALPKYPPDVVWPLCQAYQSSFVNFVPPPGLTEHAVRDAMGELSPLDEAGLGALDDLHHLSEVEQFYVFFRQVLFRMEQGMSGGALSPPQA
jgi:hypothetical protein